MAREENRNVFKATAIPEKCLQWLLLGTCMVESVAYWLIFVVSFVQARVIWGKEASAEKMPTSDGPASKSVGAFSSKWEGPSYCGRATLRGLFWLT